MHATGKPISYPYTKNSVVKIDPKPLPNPITILIKHQRRRRNNHSQKRENRNPPPITQLLENRRSKKRRNATQNAPESCAGRNGTSSVLLKAIDVVVLASVEDHDLADAVEVRRSDGREPVRVQLDRPREPEERDGDEDGADVG